MKTNGIGYVYRPKYRDKATGEVKQSAVWWISYTHNGVKYRESSKSPKEAVARALLKDRIGKAGLGKPVTSAVRRTTLDDLARLVLSDYENQGYDSRARQEDAFNHLKEFRGPDVLAEEITTQWLGEYIDFRRQQPDGRSLKRDSSRRYDKPVRVGCAAATINRELEALRRAFTLAARNSPPLVANVPHIALLKTRNRRKGFFEWEQFEAVRDHLPDYLKAPMTCAYYTGWRTASELLTRQKHHLVDGMLILEPDEAKNEEPRRFPLDVIPELRETIEQQLEATRKLELESGSVIPWLFHNQGNPIRKYERSWRTACKAANCVGRIPHDFRRTAARNLINAGVDPFTTMELVGWKDIAMLRRYNIINEATLTSGVEKLKTYIDSQKQKPAKVVGIRG